jgi:hypothetical protein
MSQAGAAFAKIVMNECSFIYQPQKPLSREKQM